MKAKTYYEVWFSMRGHNTMRDYETAYSLTEAKKIATQQFKKGNTDIIIDSWQMEAGEDSDINDDSRKYYSMSEDGKSIKQF